ncbi:MAG: sporulation protein YqfC [Bacillota bacterium]
MPTKVRGRHLRSLLADLTDLPKDIVLDMPRITMVGNVQIYLENHRGIVDFDGDSIRINISSGAIRITGKNLVVRNIMIDEIIIDGDIRGIDFEQSEQKNIGHKS